MAILCSLMKLTQPFQSESSLICILKELGAGVIIPTFHVHDKIALPSILVFFSFLIFQIFLATKIILFVYRRAANTRAHSMVTTLKWIVTVLISLGLLFFLENFVTNVDLELCFYFSTHTTYMICVSFWMKKKMLIYLCILKCIQINTCFIMHTKLTIQLKLLFLCLLSLPIFEFGALHVWAHLLFGLKWMWCTFKVIAEFLCLCSGERERTNAQLKLLSHFWMHATTCITSAFFLCRWYRYIGRQRKTI